MGPHFTDKEAKAEKPPSLPRIKCLASSKAKHAEATSRAFHHLLVTSQPGSHCIKSAVEIIYQAYLQPGILHLLMVIAA